MKTRQTLILLLILVAVCAFIWIKERHGGGFDARKAAAEKVHDFDPTAVAELVVLNQDGAIVAKKEGITWKLVEPLTATADQFEIESMILALNSLRFDREIPLSEIDPESFDRDYRLKRPSHILSWSTPGQRHSLRLGADTPMGGAMFVQKEEDGPVYVVPRHVRETLARELNHLRDRTIFPFHEADIRQVDIRSLDPAQPWQVQFTAQDGHVRVTKPIDARMDQQKAEGLIRFLSDCRAMDFVSESAADLITYGLSEPDLEVTVRATDPDKPMTLLIGHPVKNDPGKYYARLKDSNSVITITAELVRELTRPLNDFRDTALLDRFPHELNAIDIDFGGGKLRLLRDGDTWKVSDTNGPKADAALIGRLLEALMSTRIIAFVSDAPESLKTFGLEPPAASLTLNPSGVESDGDSSAHSLRFDFSKPDKNGVNAKRSDELFIYRTGRELFDLLKASPDDFVNRTAAQIAPGMLTGMSILRSNGQTATIIFDSADGKWKLEGEANGVINNERLGVLLQALQDGLRANVAQAVKDPSKVVNPAPLILTLSTKDGEQIFTFGRLDKKSGRPMTVSTEPGIVFFMDESFFRLLDQELITTVPAPPVP